MRYFPLWLCIYCCYACGGYMQELNQGDYIREAILQNLRQEEVGQDTLFNVKRVASQYQVAYFCALVKDKKNQYVSSKNNKYHLYDRIMLGTDQGWFSAVRLDSEADSPESAHCFYAPDVVLQSQTLLAKVEQEGRKELCQPVHKGDPLRAQLLGALRTRYIGDSNTITLNGALPETKFVVEKLCASDKYAYFYGRASGDPRSVYSENKNNLEVILQAGSNGGWHTVPENKILTQQATVPWRQYDGYFSTAMLAEMAQHEERHCALESDTVSVTGIVRQESVGDAVYWVVVLDKPLTCVRDADQRFPGWNEKMQLLLTAQERETVKDLLGKKVIVGGDILLALSDSHHTPLLLGNIFRLQELK
ncbi:TPA: DUF4431 domain-containing protein [Klebsiella aerogenes]|nr:DUF4431 domain-containing protein [Klebsiella aerogenes]